VTNLDKTGRVRARVLRRLAFGAALLTGAFTTAGFGFAPPAHADDSMSTSITGYSASVQALGVQIAFNIPGIVPLPNENLIEEDLPFVRTNVGNGPVVNALGAPYYPGDILADIGSLLGEFTPPGTPAFPNDPLLAEADYPPAPGHGADASFGGTPPAGLPIAPNVFSATSHADAKGGTATATLLDVAASSPSGTSSALARMGPTPASALGKTLGSLGSLPALGTVRTLAGSTGPALDVGSVQANNTVSIGQSEITGTASDVLKGIDIAGVLDISQIVSSADSSSDGNEGNPNASLHLVDVTVDGQEAYIDNHGVHVSSTTTTPAGVTPAQAQEALDQTFAQDGINVRLVDPQTTTSGAEGTSNSGGLVVSISHQFDVPYIPGEPTIPVPELGNVGLPAGLYTATTSITLGSATSDVQAASAPSSPGLSVGLPGGGSLGLGLGSLGSGLDTGLGISPGSFGSAPGGSAPSTSAAGSGPSALGARASSRLPLGIPAPVGWLIAAIVLCVIVAYPMLLAARWQFLSGRGR